MKKSLLLITASAIVLLLASCGGPKADVKKMLKMYEEYSETAFKASEDKVLDEKEIEELNKIMADIEEFGTEMDEKYENDEEATKEFESHMSEDQNKEIVKEYTKALMALWSCEGAENLK
jgi:vacuolar-type H+-ATPase subunit I/STV1